MSQKIMIIFCLQLLAISIFGQQVKYNNLKNAKRGNYTGYFASDKAVYFIGDTLTIGTPSEGKTFSYISQGDGIITPFSPVFATDRGLKTEIIKIWVVGTKRGGYSVSMRTKGAIAWNYTIQFENALASGEIIGKGKTSDQAFNELKRAKEKLDLEIITQEQYDKIKAELIKYIE